MPGPQRSTNKHIINKQSTQISKYMTDMKLRLMRLWLTPEVGLKTRVKELRDRKRYTLISDSDCRMYLLVGRAISCFSHWNLILRVLTVMLISMKAKWYSSSDIKQVTPLHQLSLIRHSSSLWGVDGRGKKPYISWSQREPLLSLSCLGKVTCNNRKPYLKIWAMPCSQPPTISSDF